MARRVKQKVICFGCMAMELIHIRTKTVNKVIQKGDCSQFVAFAKNADSSFPFDHGQVFDLQGKDLVQAHTGSVCQQHEGVVPAADTTTQVRFLEKGLYCFLADAFYLTLRFMEGLDALPRSIIKI